MDTRKRWRPEAGFIASGGGLKKIKHEMGTLSTSAGSKSKPCTKFFSTVGCGFGENCHFLHYFPGGYNVVAQMINLGPTQPRNAVPPALIPNGSSTTVAKGRMCNKYNTADGCKFGDKCHFAHGEWELSKPIAPSHDHSRAMMPCPCRFGGRMEPTHSCIADSFGASASAKISVDASLAGAIIGMGGTNAKQICRQTGAKLSIREHESDPNRKNIELEGSFEQIQQASAMVRELILSIGPVAAHAKMPVSANPQGNNIKTKLCDNFTKGSCTFGVRCHFAHGTAELRTTGI